MSTLADFTNVHLIIPELRSRDCAGIAAELCSELHREACVGELLPFYHAIITREAACSTATPPGWALPHARLTGLKRLCFAVGRTLEPISWFGQKRQRVRLVFLFAVPESESAEFQNVIASLARASQDSAFCEAMLASESPDQILSLLSQRKLRQPKPNHGPTTSSLAETPVES